MHATFPTAHRFSKFFHRNIQQQVCKTVIVKNPAIS